MLSCHLSEAFTQFLFCHLKLNWNTLAWDICLQELQKQTWRTLNWIKIQEYSMCGAGMMMMVFIPLSVLHSVGFPLELKRWVCFAGYEQFVVVLSSFHKIFCIFAAQCFLFPSLLFSCSKDSVHIHGDKIFLIISVVSHFNDNFF